MPFFVPPKFRFHIVFVFVRLCRTGANRNRKVLQGKIRWTWLLLQCHQIDTGTVSDMLVAVSFFFICILRLYKLNSLRKSDYCVYLDINA